jgi:hypothetical protein
MKELIIGARVEIVHNRHPCYRRCGDVVDLLYSGKYVSVHLDADKHGFRGYAVSPINYFKKI